MVAEAVDLSRWGGTVRALSTLVEIHTGVAPEIEESGGVAWSEEPDGKPPGDPEPWVNVILRVPDPSAIDVVRLERVLQEVKPAEVVLHLEVLRG